MVHSTLFHFKEKKGVLIGNKTLMNPSPGRTGVTERYSGPVKRFQLYTCPLKDPGIKQGDESYGWRRGTVTELLF